jgi:hypothetical protein
MVGTKAMRPAPERAARSSAMRGWICMVRISVAMFGAREMAFPDVGDVARDSVVDAGGAFHEVLGEARAFAGENADQVMQHQHLAMAVHSGTDADGGHGRKAGGDVGGQAGRHHFHDDQCCTRLFKGQRIGLEDGGPCIAAALDAVAAQLVHRLGGQPDVGAYGHATLDQESERFQP